MWIGQELTDVVLCHLLCNVSILNISAEYVEMTDVVQFLRSPPDGHVASKEFDLF